MKVSKIFVLFNVILITHYLVFGMSKKASKNAISFKKFREDLSKKIAKNKKAILITLGSLIGAAAVSAGVGYGIYKHKKKNKYGKPGYYRSSVPYTSSTSSSQAKKAPAKVETKSIIEARHASSKPASVPVKSTPVPAKAAPAPAKAAPAPAKGAPAPAKAAPAPARGAPAPAKAAPAPAKGAPAPARTAPAPAKAAPAPARSVPAPAPAPAKPAASPASPTSRPAASPTTYPPVPASPALSKSTTPPPRSSPPTVGGGSSAYNNIGTTRPGTTTNMYGSFKY